MDVIGGVVDYINRLLFLIKEDMMRQQKLFLAVIMTMFLSLMLGGCGSKKVEPKAVEPTPMAPTESLETQPSADDNIMEGRTSGPMVPVYFDFDSSAIRNDQVARIEKNADFLKSKESVAIRIEGNCDERGTNEYNLALGERRAQSAKQYLVNLGVDAGRLSTVSWGEEKALLHGHDELSWAQNRRDDFVIVK
jgi:peptidoglycan-associated lipoprotein